MGPRRSTLLATGAAALLTALLTLTSSVVLNYRSPSLHAAVETTAALVSLLAAQLVYGRFRRSLDRRDLLLTAALGLFAASNLLFSAIPAAVERTGPFPTWASAGGSAAASAVLAIAAVAEPHALRRPGLELRRSALLCLLILGVITVAVAVAGDTLPRAVDPGLSPEGLGRTRVIGPPAMLATQFLLACLLAIAARGFSRRSRQHHDAVMLCFAVGATLGAWSRLNYMLFPSLYSDYFYTGDVLRLAFFVALMIGGIQEIRFAQRELERVAVLGERRRLAREIHDGVAQELAFIVQQGEHLATQEGGAPVLGDIAIAGRRALDESRSLISALTRPTDEPLGEALTRVAEEAAGRWGAVVHAETVSGLEVPASTRQALLRVVGEAVTNAVRHGDAQVVRLALRCDPDLQVVIDDDGRGFDPAAVEGRNGHHGIRGMRERVEALGGDLRISSRAGEGTQVLVALP